MDPEAAVLSANRLWPWDRTRRHDLLEDIMKQALLELLICPHCRPQESPLQVSIQAARQDDIITGSLSCPLCQKVYPIADGIAFLTPQQHIPQATNRYEMPAVVASYLWSHYGDLLGDDMATDAYQQWAGLMRPSLGNCLDGGCAVGRFAFEMAKKFDLVVGLDNSVAFIRTARELMAKRRLDLLLPEEGKLQRPVTLTLPPDWPTLNLDFIVADAQALPFRAKSFSGLASLNMVDKLPDPLAHLSEINRVAKPSGAQFLFSDPFSWSTDVAPETAWLGGTESGPFAGRAQTNIIDLLEGKKGCLEPCWQVESHGPIWWKIRTHCNHYEMIRSCFIKAKR